MIDDDGDTYENVPEVISVEDDDDDEDVEVVFTNLNKSHVYRNLICQKISQELELLQAMCKQTVPNEFDKFKEKAKKLGFQYGDDVIRSAWQRIMKKYLMKLSSFPNNSAPICLVRPNQSSVDISPLRVNAPLSFPNSSVTGPSSSPPPTSTAIPVALILNKSVSTENVPLQSTECFIGCPNLVGIGTNMNDKINQTSNAEGLSDKQVVSSTEIRCIQVDAESGSRKKVSLVKKDTKIINSKTDVFSSELNEEGFSKNCSKRSDGIQNSDKNKETQKPFLKKNTSIKHFVSPSTRKTVGQTENIVSNPESICSKTNAKSPKNNVSSEIKCLKKRKTSTDILCTQISSDLDMRFLSKRGSLDGESDVIQNVSALSVSHDNYFHSTIPEQNQLVNGKKITPKSSQKRKSSSKQVVPIESSKTVRQAIVKSHVGVKAKIVRRTSSINSKKRLSKIVKEMSEAELKEFKAEQKRLKYEEKCQFEQQQLQKLHDRLVDVLIPKYYSKDLGEKG